MINTLSLGDTGHHYKYGQIFLAISAEARGATPILNLKINCNFLPAMDQNPGGHYTLEHKASHK